MSEIEIAYDGSALSVGHNAGGRLPPEHYDGAPPGSGDTPRFILYAADIGKARALASCFPNLIESVARTPPSPDRLLIVRPDAYIGFSAEGSAWDNAKSYLEHL